MTWSERYSYPAPARVVAIGDLHGDLGATRAVLRLAGAIDAKDAWIGGALVVVQTGDEIDRGDDDRAIVDLFERLKTEAVAAGGKVLALSGNHEVMNAQKDFRYVTPGAFASFQSFGSFASASAGDGRARDVPAEERGRAEAFAPGGPYARKLADRPVVVKVGDDVFVHGGVLPKHVRYGLERTNDEVRDFFLGTRPAPPPAVTQEDGLVWTRAYSAAPSLDDCRTLDDALTMMGARRMIVGHTVQRDGISSACKDHVFRIDTGMSKFYGGKIQLLEITPAGTRVVRAE